MICANPTCKAEFNPIFGKPSQVYCCQQCRRAASRKRTLERRKKAPKKPSLLNPNAVCRLRECGKSFRMLAGNHWYCSATCRDAARRRVGFLAGAPSARRGRPPLCKWCRGKHTSDRCPNPTGGFMVKRYGSVGPNREYVPPRGLEVRVLVIPPTVHGDQLAAILKEMES